MNQVVALQILKSGRNVFLTGAPGTGKTFVLLQYIDYLRSIGVNLSVTASTGIAASYLNGSTLHSFAGLGILNDYREEFWEELSKKKYLIKKIKKTEVLIIDEVSMLSPQVFLIVDKILRLVKENDEPFGGIQVVFSGDFFQLSPVGTEISKEKYVWQTDLWNNLDLEICYLDENHRSKDVEYNNILNEIRLGQLSSTSKNILYSRVGYKTLIDKDVTKLYTHNIDVDRINSIELRKLSSVKKKFISAKRGNKKILKSFISSLLVPDVLELKLGAFVMFTKNNPDKGYINGTLGKIVDFDPVTGFPIVETCDTIITVKPEGWQREDEEGNVIASVRQIPLKLAWAITVHKSQGMTLDRAISDLSKCFVPGQGYVALSRVKSLDGLYLLGLSDTALKVDNEVRKFDFLLKELSMRACKKNMKKENKAKLVLKTLKNHYSKTGPFLNWSNPFELLVAVCLSAQCTDKKVNQVTKKLFSIYKTPLDYANANLKELEKIIFSTGFYKNKAKNLKNMGRRLVECFDSEVPKTMDELISLPGVGKKTAAIVLSKAFGINISVAVDTHVKRLSIRLGIVNSTDGIEKIRVKLNSFLDKDEYLDFNEYMITHGRKVCLSNKLNCEVCVLNKLCDKNII